MQDVILGRKLFYSAIDPFVKKIFVFGGTNPVRSLDTIECYQIEEDKWHEIDLKLPSPNFAFSYLQTYS